MITTQAVSKLELLLRSFYPFICPPKTDMLDLAAVALGIRETACLYMEEQSLKTDIFRNLVEIGKLNGIFISDLNGNPHLNNDEYKVPVWIVCRSADTLKEVLKAHMVYQPRGFTAWARCFGKILGYPGCCVEAYVSEVHDPSGREAFWKKVQARVHAHKEIILGFAPCSFTCREAYRQICERLSIAYRIGILDVSAATAWLSRKQKISDIAAIIVPEILVDLKKSLSPPLKIPI